MGIGKDRLGHREDSRNLKYEDWENLPAYAQLNDEWGEGIEAILQALHAVSYIAPDLADQMAQEAVSQIRERITNLYRGDPWGDGNPEDLGLPSLEEFQKRFLEQRAPIGAVWDDVVDWAIEHYDEDFVLRQRYAWELKIAQTRLDSLRPTEVVD